MQTQYLQNSKLTPYQSSDLSHNIMYMNPSSSAAASLPDLLPANSLAAHSYVEAQPVDNREEMLFMAPSSGNHVIMQPMDRHLDVAASFSGSNAVMVDPQSFAKNLIHVQNADLNNLQHQGLSLSLGNHVPSSIQMPSYHNPYTNLGMTSMLTAQVDHPDEHGSQSSDLRKAEYFSFDSTRRSNSSIKNSSLYDPQSSISPKEINSDSRLHDGTTVVGGMVYSSKYVKAVQELLDEVVNVHQDLKQQEKHCDFQSFVHDVPEETKLKSSCHQSRMPAVSSDELSPTERNELHNKMTKLLSMLDEVDRRYRQYHQQMQVVASSFEIVAGCGAARRYTALALRTISCQFRCLRDTIKKQIQAVQQSLGEQSNFTNGQGLSRLRFVDQQVRQQRNLQQFGVLRQPWRPQRGLPETAVSVLRAWLFEHFLHPYPKDSEKIMLARQTGLSRSQVANWFINARVRLWKPMIEEMYKDEFGNVEGDCNKSSEIGQAVLARWKSESEDADFHDSSMSVTADRQMGKSEVEVKKTYYTTKFSFQDDSYEDDFSMLGGGGNQEVSLALGLQHSETDQISGGRTQSGGDGTATASVGIADKAAAADYYCVDAINQQDRFSSPHLLPDFVV